MSYATELAQVQEAIATALSGKKIQHGDDIVERQDLEQLYKRERELLTRVQRRSRGPRVSGFRLRHN